MASARGPTMGTSSSSARSAIMAHTAGYLSSTQLNWPNMGLPRWWSTLAMGREAMTRESSSPTRCWLPQSSTKIQLFSAPARVLCRGPGRVSQSNWLGRPVRLYRLYSLPRCSRM